MADWRELYKATVLETNSRKLKHLVQKTEGAIFERLQKLTQMSRSERNAIAEASLSLLVLKRERLAWPDARQSWVGLNWPKRMLTIKRKRITSGGH
jgi:hypothetical protein